MVSFSFREFNEKGGDLWSVRKPTWPELMQLAEYIKRVRGLPDKEAGGEIEGLYIAIIDGYVSSAPGYVGSIMFVVGGWPDYYTAYYWDREGKIIPLDMAEDIREVFEDEIKKVGEGKW